MVLIDGQLCRNRERHLEQVTAKPKVEGGAAPMRTKTLKTAPRTIPLPAVTSSSLLYRENYICIFIIMTDL
jgi:hypothetical protein